MVSIGDTEERSVVRQRVIFDIHCRPNGDLAAFAFLGGNDGLPVVSWGRQVFAILIKKDE